MVSQNLFVEINIVADAAEYALHVHEPRACHHAGVIFIPERDSESLDGRARLNLFSESLQVEMEKLLRDIADRIPDFPWNKGVNTGGVVFIEYQGDGSGNAIGGIEKVLVLFHLE